MPALPPDNRAVGTGNPAADFDAVDDVLALITGAAPGGTVTVQQTINTLAGGVTAGQYLRGNGSNVALSPILVGDLPANGPWVPADNGLLVANGDWLEFRDTSTLTAGTLYLAKLMIRSAITWTNVWFSITTSGVGASTGCFTGLYNSAGTLLSPSADIGATFTGSTGAKSVPLSTPQPLAAGTFVWVAFLCNLATTQVTLQSSGASVGSGNVNLTSTVLRFAVNGTGLTGLPGTITPSSNTGTGSLRLAVAGN